MHRLLKHLCEITTYPLWQHRPHGILVHYTVAICKNRQKTARTRTPNQICPYFLGSGGFRDSSPSTSLAEGPLSQLRVCLSLSLSLCLARIALPKWLRLEITCGWFNARVNRLRLPKALAQLRIHKYYMILLFSLLFSGTPVALSHITHTNISQSLFLNYFYQSHLRALRSSVLACACELVRLSLWGPVWVLDLGMGGHLWNVRTSWPLLTFSQSLK